jgi:hypothetical protein
MNLRLVSLAALAAASAIPARAEAPVADLDIAVRCGALFGIINSEQKRGVASALEFPPLETRGKEFFVRTAARLMDERQLTREEVGARFKAETEKLQAEVIAASDPAAAVATVATPCFALLDAAIPQ